MSFDKDTRNALSKMVAICRRLLTEDVTDQLRGRFGMHPDGTILSIDYLDLDEDEQLRAEALRELLEHFAAGEAVRADERRRRAYDRLVLEISFTALNRLAALRLCEERDLVVECVRQGTASAGFQMFERVSGGALGARYQTYRVFLECLFDELALDLGVLFDRSTPQSCVFPGERCLADVLAELNKPELAHLWAADETIGWIYQYFNPPEERKAMRDAAQAPRNSRELAVRNQFFTPRYVVEFLTDNTLGRIWYEMRTGDTALKEECRYLVRRANEVFLSPGEKAPPADEADTELSRQELLKQPVYIEHRPKKDPRDLRILDPACGSGHFLLYAFDLLERIYEEAWHDPESPKCEATRRCLREEEDLQTVDQLRRAVPKLVVEHNLHGIDIDPRAVQIAALALWLRAQKAWTALGLKANDRPRIERSNIVTAEPMPGEEDMRREFTAGVKPRVLGQLVHVVFEKMKLAGEAGSLLKIEDEIKDVVAMAKAEFVAEKRRRRDAAGYLPGMARPREATLFDFTDLSEEEFWGKAEDLILAALKEYAEQAENGSAVRRRLFAEDAARGFAFVDLSRKQYDVALMNPPFGEFSTPAKMYARNSFPSTYNDIFGAFTERFLFSLVPRGFLGAITSRTGFFLTSFSRWREDFLLRRSAIRVLADLGSGVMDDAMVESAAYCLEHVSPGVAGIFIRLLGVSNRENTLNSVIECLRKGSAHRAVFFAYQREFQSLSESPFVYWVSSEDIRKIGALNRFEPTAGEVRQGLVTGDNPRFVRALWEVPTSAVAAGPKLLGEVVHQQGSLRKTMLRLLDTECRWVPHVMAGSSQPWYSPITLAVNYCLDGRELKNFRNASGKLRSRPQNTDFYFRPGFSWTRRAVRFIPYAIPIGCISTASRYMAFPKPGLEFATIGVTASNVASAFLRFYGEKFEWPNFLVKNVKVLPWPSLPENLTAELEGLARQEVAQRRQAYQNHEPFQDFVAPALLFDTAIDDALTFDRRSLLGYELDTAVSHAYGFDGSAEQAIVRDLYEAIEACGVSVSVNGSVDGDEDEGNEEDRDFVLDISPRSEQEAFLSYVVGCVFGRWDVRIGRDPSLAPSVPGPFDAIPVCPPGTLVGPDGMPGNPSRIVSEEWLRARTDASTLPLEGTASPPSIPDAEYPLRVSWDGIIVDDFGFNGAQPHRDDIVRRVREVLDLLLKDKAHRIEQDACELLGIKELRDYFRRPAGFFQDHLKRYSKSRRKAPIYWPLSTASGSYTIWIYYHRLTDQTLYAAVNKYVEPKIAEVERATVRMEKELESASGREATKLRDRLSEGRTLASELRDLRQELLRIAALPYKPNLNDGVIINAAPFHKLFGLRSWAKDTQNVWTKLEKGGYEWAHLSYTLWSDRVKEVCREDRSIAIAHRLEQLCEVEAPVSKRRGKKKEVER